jgi:subtilisin family serine protease
MKKPKLGNREFLSKNTKRLLSFEEFQKQKGYLRSNEEPLYTGRYFAVLKEKSQGFSKIQTLLESEFKMSVASSKDFSYQNLNEENIEQADVLIYDELGLALLSAEEDQVQILESAGSDADYFIIPEKVVYLPDDEPSALSLSSTWGIMAIKADRSQYSGNGVGLAVLDTGFDLNHPDFTSRVVHSNSFVPGQSVQDTHGHGTHCIGTACGTVDTNGTRYGVATKSNIYVGKVLNNSGSGAQSWILNGIMWAINEGCKVISMSLGSRVFPGQGYDPAYENAAHYALANGSILVAAAGNESRRSWNQFEPVGSPADSPSVISVGAIDKNFNIADFSNRAINPTGLVDIVGPGVDIYSSWPMQNRYRTISGTSMATPHIAGILALLWEQNPNATPNQIIQKLKNNAQSLPLPLIDVGAGLALAP